MDEKRLRRRLIWLYAATTASVLAAVFAALLLLSVRNDRQKDMESFSALFTTVASQLRTETALSHSALRSYELDNGIYFRVTDSWQPSKYNHDDDTERLALFAAAEALARDEGVDVSGTQLSSRYQVSPVLQFRAQGRRLLGAASVIPAGDTLRTLTAVKPLPENGVALRSAAYALGYVLSVLLLSIMGTALIDRALRPAVESRARQTEFIAAASHELRSPLAVISANADTVRAMPERAAAAADTISDECGRMASLISDMLLLAATDAKSWTLTPAMLEPDTLLLNVYESYQPVFARQGMRLELVLPEEPLPPLYADEARLNQVLSILLDNALNYAAASENKTVVLSCSRLRRQTLIELSDHGCGIPDDKKERIFDRFYRGDRSRGDKQHFGLGLAIAKELVTLSGAALTVRDTPGGGSTFRICI